MKVNGIVAEYNPFHNGHKYQMALSKQLTGADFTIVVMSGNFVQRGAPALVNKHLRAEMALRCGADLVLELPALYATASSEYFAAGSVALLDKLGVVSHLCFGSECGDAAALEKLAAFLAAEPESYRSALKQLLKQGLSYPDARARALSGLADPPARGRNVPSAPADASGGAETAQIPGTETLPGNCASILSSPNNILGIDYIKELFKRKSVIAPVTIKRLGAGYHDALSAAERACMEAKSKPSDSAFPPAVPNSPGPADMPAHSDMPPASALALRQALQEGQSPERLRPFIPEEIWPLLDSCMSEARLLYPDSLSGVLYYKLLLEREQGYEKYLDVSPDLSNRIRNSLNGFTGFGSFCDTLKTKAFTHTRISRCLLHILLGITQEDMAAGRAQDYVPYARVLGFRRDARPLLHAVREHSAVPLITKLADTAKNLPADAGRLFNLDILSAEIYKGLAYGGTGRPAPNEISTPPVIL